MQELVTRGLIDLRNVPGTANPADALTKHVAPKSVFREYMSCIYQVDAARFTALRREQPEQERPVDDEVAAAPGASQLNFSQPWVDARINFLLHSSSPPTPPWCSPPSSSESVRQPPPSPPCSPPGSPESTRPPTPTPPASPIRCEDAEGNLAASLAPATLLERQDLADALMLLASQPPPLPRPAPTPCLTGAVTWVSKKLPRVALPLGSAELPVPAVLTPTSVAPPMLGPGYPSDVAGDGPISACCGERWTECDGCGWVVCPLCLNVDLFELVEDTGGRVRRERTAGCAHQYRISRCSWLVTGTDGQGRRLPVCGCHREYLKLEDSDGD